MQSLKILKACLLKNIPQLTAREKYAEAAKIYSAYQSCNTALLPNMPSVAQAYGEFVPIFVMPMGYPRSIEHSDPQFNSVLNFKHVTKSTEPAASVSDIPDLMHRAFTHLPNDRERPVLI